MRHVTFNPLLFWISPGLISCIFIWNKKKSVWYNFYQGTSVSITFYIFEHYQLWMMDSKGQRVFFPKTPQLCVWHTEVRRCYHFKLVSLFQLWFPIWGVLVNRLNLSLQAHIHLPLISSAATTSQKLINWCIKLPCIFFYLFKIHYTQMYVIVWMKKSVATAVSSWPLTPKVFSLKISLLNVFEFADESYNLVSSVVSCYQGVGGGRAKRYSSQRQRAVPEPAPMHIGVMEGHYYEPSECSTAFGP